MQRVPRNNFVGLNEAQSAISRAEKVEVFF